MPGVKITSVVLAGEAPDSLESGFFAHRTIPARL
jgi:hypothetical protein